MPPPLPLHLVSEHPELQYVATLTTNNAQETNALSIISTCHARASTLVSLVLIGDQPTTTSKSKLVPERSLIIECDQVFYRPLLPFKHTKRFQPMPPTEYPHTPYTKAYPHTKLLQHTSCRAHTNLHSSLRALTHDYTLHWSFQATA